MSPISFDAGHSTRKIHNTNPSPESVERIRRAYQKQLGKKPTRLQRSLILHAAIVAAAFEQAATDGSTSANDLVRLSGEARRSRLDMMQSFEQAARRADDEVIDFGALA